MVEMVLQFDEHMQDKHGPDYDAEELGVGTQPERQPEPEYSQAPIISDDQIDRKPCVQPGHPADCICLACNSKLPSDLTQLTIEEVHDEQDHELGDQQQ